MQKKFQVKRRTGGNKYLNWFWTKYPLIQLSPRRCLKIFIILGCTIRVTTIQKIICNWMQFLNERIKCWYGKMLGISSTWKVAKSITTKLQGSEAFFTFIGPILCLIWICSKWRICSRLMWSFKGTNGAGLGIFYEKMSLQWPDK